VVGITAAPAAAQQQPPDSVAAELARLRARLDSLEALVRELRAAGQEEEAGDALSALRAAAQEAAGEGGPRPDTATDRQEFVGRQRSLQSLNPEISVTADALGHLDTDDVDRENFVPREFEISFQSSLDPYSRAKVFASVHNPGPELMPFEGAEEDGEAHAHDGPEVGVEEGYVEWVGLPGSINVKLGRFFQQFGQLNRWHSHALPTQGRSLPHLAFIGEEPLAQAGASVSWLVPVHGAGTWTATAELTRSSNEALFGESRGVSVLGNLNGFWQLTDASDLDLSLSWTNGSYEDETSLFDRNLFGAEAAFTWRPPARALYRGVVVRAGAMLLDGLGPREVAAGADDTDRALGLWSYAEVRLGRQWYVGSRADWTEDPLDPDRTAWLVAPTLTWWQSEWVRLRLEYDVLGRSPAGDDEGHLWLQVTYAMGPHKHETY
jgi:hypothetical protein